MHLATLNRDSTLVHHLDRRPGSVGTFDAYGPAGESLVAAGTPVLGTCNTTLASAAAAGTLSLTLTSASGVAVGQRFLVGGAEDTGGETVTVRSLSGTTATLVRPLRGARGAGDTFQSTRVSFPIPAAALTRVTRGCRVEYEVGADYPVTVLAFHVVRYIPQSHLTLEDLRDLDPIIGKRIPEGTWLPGLVARGWDVMLSRLVQRVNPGGLVGTVDLTLAHGYLTRALLAETAGGGAEVTAYRENMERRYGQELDAAVSACVYDPNQDGTTKTQAVAFQALRIQRT